MVEQGDLAGVVANDLANEFCGGLGHGLALRLGEDGSAQTVFAVSISRGD